MNEEQTPLRLLLVDDDMALRGLTATHLRKAGYDVEVATNGQEGLDAALREPPDILVSDIMMPLLDGVELLQRVRQDERLRHAYVILLTAKDRMSDMVAGFQATADDYLTKPFNVKALVARVHAGARMVRVRDELKRTNARLQEALRDRADLLGIAAHDLRNPVSILTTYLSLFGKGVVSDEEICEVCLRRAHALGDLIDDILDISRIDAGKVRVGEPQRARLGVMLGDAYDLYHPVAQEKSVELSMAPGNDETCEVMCDPFRMQEALNTLVEAGVNLVGEGGGAVLLQHEVGDAGGVVLVRIGGCPLPAGARAHLLTPSNRDSDMPLCDASTLIGIAIVRKLVEMMGGAVFINDEGEDLVLGFSIPLAE